MFRTLRLPAFKTSMAQSPIQTLTVVLGRCLLIMLAIYAGGRLGHATAYTETNVSLIWLPPGIAVAALYRWGVRYWPAVYLGIVVVEYSVIPALSMIPVMALGSTLGPVVTTGLLRSRRFDSSFISERDVLLFVFAALIGMVLPASSGVASLWLAGFLNASSILATWLIWWSGDTVGVMLSAPFLLALGGRNLQSLIQRRGEVLIFIGLFTALSLSAFFLSRGSGGAYLLYVMTIWATMRFGILGGSLAITATSLLAALATAARRGPFDAGRDGLIALWLYVCTQSVMSLLITAIQSVGIRANHSLQDSLGRLQKSAAELAIARDRADAANRAKSEFLANMSHEIRTPLTAILGYAEVLCTAEGDLANPAQRSRTIESIRSAGRHLITVIDDILDLSKIEANRLTIERIEIPLVSTLMAVEQMVQPRARVKHLHLSTRILRPLPDRILSDPTRLRQILLNLLGNAVKFTETGRVTMTVSDEQTAGGRQLTIEIEDTGSGISAAQSARLFIEFSQGDGTVTRAHGGTGLGLVISQRLARMMGGDLQLVRSQPDRGSLFRLTLPLVPARGAIEVTSLEPPVSNPPAGEPQADIALTGKVLVAEDCPDIQALIAFYLQDAGATVETAENGEVALRMIAEAETHGVPYDLLLTDMQMPVCDGYSLARRLRARGSILPIVALTAHSMAEDRNRCLEAGCDDYHSKPIDRRGLLSTCHRWLSCRTSPVATQP